MKKLFAFVLFTSFTCQLGAWSSFFIKNDTKNTVEFITESIKKNILAGITYKIVNHNYYANGHVGMVRYQIMMGKDENWFKIGEKAPSAGRTYTIAQRIDIGYNARRTIRVKNILNIKNRHLRKGFKYHKYSMGLKQMNETHETGEIQVEQTSTPTFNIENDTDFEVSLLCIPIDSGKAQKIHTENTFTVKSQAYRNYINTSGARYMSRYLIKVDKNNEFVLKIKENEVIHKITIKVTRNLKNETTLKISNIMNHSHIPKGFRITSHTTPIIFEITFI